MKRFFEDYLAELRNSPFKTGTIAVLLAGGLLLWGRLLMKEVPRTASAWDPLAVLNAQDAPPILPTPGPPPDALRLPEPPELKRDLFGLDPSRYRRTAAQENRASQAKPDPLDTEDTHRAAVVSAARSLRLTSVIEGEEPVVIINNKLLRRGDTIDGFTVQSFAGRSVVLEKQGVRVRLSL